MKSTGHPTGLSSLPQAVEPSPDKSSNRSSSFFLAIDLPITRDGKSIIKPLMLWPLALHFLGSVIVTVTLVLVLDGCDLYLERQPQVKLADGTIESSQSRFNLLQSDATTILSVSLTVLRWIAAAWAGPLCWRVIFLLAEKNGLRRRDIKWASSYGLLHPTTNFQHPLNLVLGLILILTLAHYAASPLLIGSISWVPSSLTLEPASHPTINITGFLPGDREGGNGQAIDGTAISTFDTDAVMNFNAAWDQNAEELVFKRVVPSVAKLAINSTVERVLVPFFAVTRFEWLPKGEEQLRKLPDLQKGNDKIGYLFSQLERPGVAAVVVNYTTSLVDRYGPPIASQTLTMTLIVNVGRKMHPQYCDSTTTLIPDYAAISSFYVDSMPTQSLSGSACFSYVNVTYTAGSGFCRACRIGTYSTVQNDTELEMADSVHHDQEALNSLPRYLHTFARLTNSLPDPADDLEAYITALITRSYSTLWITWAGTRAASYSRSSNHLPPDPNLKFITSSYRPSFPTLRAKVDQARVAVWLALQLSITLSGLLFIWLQSSSKHPLVTDTSMIAFDIDSTEVAKPSGSSKDEAKERLTIEPSDDGWKVLVASGRRKHNFEKL